MSSNNDHGGGSATNHLPADSESASQQDGPAGDDERAEVDSLKDAIAKAKLSARKKRLRQARAEAALAEQSVTPHDIDWGPMQHARPLSSQTISAIRPTPYEQEETARLRDAHRQDSDPEEAEGVPDLAEEGGLFSSTAAKAKRMDRSSSGLSFNSLSSSGSSAYSRRVHRERSRRALSDMVSNVTRDDNLAKVDK